MALASNNESNKRKALLACYNMTANLIWSTINLAPIVTFCFIQIEPRLVYIFLAVSLVPAFLKNSFIDKLQIGRTTAFYERIGVHLINKVAQNGVLINRLLRKRFPDHKIVAHNKASISRLINQTYMFEKFHLILFLFFDLIIVYSLVNRYWWWAFIIVITNVAYNIYPNLLQQYIRLKLMLFRNRMN